MQAEQHQPETAKRHDSPFDKKNTKLFCPIDPVRSQCRLCQWSIPGNTKKNNKNVRREEISVPRLAGNCGVGLSAEAIQAGLRDELHELSLGTTAEGPGKRCGVSHQDLTLKE